jgi:hypothetical protein
MHLRTVAFVALVGYVCLQGADWHADLRAWGYEPTVARFSVETLAGASRFLDFDLDDHVVTAFVTGPTDRLATRESPNLSVHVVTFDTEGRFISDRTLLAANRRMIELYVTANDDLLLRTDTRVRLISADGKLLVQSDFPFPSILDLFAAPDRTRFAMWAFGAGKPRPLLILDAASLAELEECSYGEAALPQGISAHNILVFIPTPKLARYRLETRSSCESPRFSYETSPGEPTQGVFLDDDRLVLPGGKAGVQLIDRGVRVWNDSFGRNEGAGVFSVRGDRRGNRFAILVGTYKGGSRLFDVSAKLTAQRVIVYNARNGKRLKEVPILKFRDFPVPEFALSPDGKLLAIKVDGDLQVVAIDEH